MPASRPSRPRPIASPPAPTPGGKPVYRVEHRLGDAVAVLAESDDPLARYTALTPLAARLLETGAIGDLVLVEQATGAVLARWALGPPAARTPEPAPVDPTPERSEVRTA